MFDDEEFCFPGCCYRCRVPVIWDPEDHRAAGEEYGSFVDNDGGFECPDGKLHQG